MPSDTIKPETLAKLNRMLSLDAPVFEPSASEPDGKLGWPTDPDPVNEPEDSLFEVSDTFETIRSELPWWLHRDRTDSFGRQIGPMTPFELMDAMVMRSVPVDWSSIRPNINQHIATYLEGVHGVFAFPRYEDDRTYISDVNDKIRQQVEAAEKQCHTIEALSRWVFRDLPVISQADSHYE